MLTTRAWAGVIRRQPGLESEGMVRIRIMRNTVCNGQAVEAGQIVETDERQGTFLVQIKKAEMAPSTPAPAPPPRGKGKRERATVEPPERAIEE